MLATVSPRPIARPQSGQSRQGAPCAPAAEPGQDPIAEWRGEILDFLRRHGPTYREGFPARWPVTRLVRDRLVEEMVREGTVALAGDRLAAVGLGQPEASEVSFVRPPRATHRATR